MIRSKALKRLITPMVAGAALALALVVGVAQAAPADPPAPTNDVWPTSLEIGA